ncbi:MAG: class I SAM-dependent DNA methyltransferase [Prolixibacteraceae bacterium]|nr:class I SAM-dependent DNA methyltransferase [Prolixibacteraceae bacterium]
MSTTISYQSIEARLPELSETTTAQELGYDLLRIFNGMSETRINRIKDGKDNLSKDPNTFVVKKLLAYSSCTTENLVECLEALKQNDKVTKAARLLVVSDGETLLGYDLVEEESYENTVDRLRYDYQFFMPLAGVERYHAPEEKEADVKAAYKMARIFDEIRRYNEIDYSDTSSIHALNVFMSRLLFCFFAEDTGIFPDKIFTSTLNDFTLGDGSDLSMIISEAFDVMSTNNASVRATKPAHISRFPYVNGGLFAEHYDVPALSWKARRLLLECGDLNWAEINPDIFGSMIQAVISPELRSSLGSHYTSVSNIMKLIQPLFLDELYAEFAAGRTNEKRLRQLLARIGRIKFLDPACGSGNFLIITYKELRKLELLIWEQIESLNHGLKEIPFSNISLTQFHGIELDEFAHETATLSLWLAEHQMNKAFESRFQTHVDALPLRRSGNIVHGNACRVDWNTVCPHTPDEEVYIMGNPPYLGGKLQNAEQKQDMLRVIGHFDSYKNLDYISCWFFLGAKYIENSNSKYAFVTTNSICQGEQVSMLWPYIYKLNLTIFFAYSSFKWANNAKYNAGVSVSIIGISKKFSGTRRIYNDLTYELADEINPYLTRGSSAIIKPLQNAISTFPLMEYGNMPLEGGFLKFEQSDFEKYIQDEGLVKFIRPLIGGDEFLNCYNRYCFWIDSSEYENAIKEPIISERVNKVRDFRLNGGDVARTLVDKSYQFRYRKEASKDFILVPCTSSESRVYLPCGYFGREFITLNSAQIIYDAPFWIFGILSSKIHMTWLRSVGGKLENRLRYSVQLCYNTFPFPKITEAKRMEIEQAAEAVLIAREMHTEKTLAQMYDPDKMPPNLREAHTHLDRVVESCYRPAPFTSDEERLEHLFALYEKMTKKV